MNKAVISLLVGSLLGCVDASTGNEESSAVSTDEATLPTEAAAIAELTSIISGAESPWWTAYNANDAEALFEYITADARLYEGLGTPSSREEYAAHSPTYAPVTATTSSDAKALVFRYRGIEHVLFSSTAHFQIPVFGLDFSAPFANLWRREEGTLRMVTNLAQLDPVGDATLAKYQPARDALLAAADLPVSERPAAVSVDRDLTFVRSAVRYRFIAGTSNDGANLDASIALYEQCRGEWKLVSAWAHRVGGQAAFPDRQ